jgi:hypothetical protein
MRGMEHPTTSQPGAANRPETIRRRRRAGEDRHEQDPQIRSLITPGVASSPILPEWLRKRFRRTDKRTSR